MAEFDDKNVPCLEGGVSELRQSVSPYGGTIRVVKACEGSTDLCPLDMGDALVMGMEIKEVYLGRKVPGDVKIAVAGCKRGCTDPLCADIGVIAKGKNMYDVFLGGCGGGSEPVHGQLLAGQVCREDVFKLLEHVLERYTSLAQPKEQIAAAVVRLGMKAFLPPADLLIGS